MPSAVFFTAKSSVLQPQKASFEIAAKANVDESAIGYNFPFDAP
ncbi:MAG TPA: hypothetical protein V6C72_00025 [Chroococcales cyanobacterium]